MSIQPIVTFKAGICDLDDSSTPPKVTPRPTPGYIYLYSEEDLVHFCWRPRSAHPDDADLDLLMLPTDGTFTPYNGSQAKSNKKPANGRLYVLKFESSPQRHLFWLQSRSQHPSQDPSWFSSRDLKLGEIVNNLLQGEEVDIRQAIADLPSDEHPDGDDDDETMEDVEGEGDPNEHHRSGSGGAGPGATGGDVREEGQGARDGGADGGRAAMPMDASTIIQNFIKSMPSGQSSAGPQERLFTTLADLLTSSSTIPWLNAASPDIVDQLLQFLPAELTTMAQEADDDTQTNVDHASIEASKQALSLTQKKEILRKVLRSPQFFQSSASLTVALRDGGLPSISEALQIPVRNGGYLRGGGVPLGGGEAVEAFVEGVKDLVQKQQQGSNDRMDTQ